MSNKYTPKTGLIYIVTDTTNGKVYVGQTTMGAKRRWWHHRAAARRNKKSLVHQAMREHGVEAFWFDVALADVPVADLNRLERLYVKLFGSNDPEYGYNSTPGGMGRPNLSEAERKAISERMKRKWSDPEFKRAMGEKSKATQARTAGEKSERMKRQWAEKRDTLLASMQKAWDDPVKSAARRASYRASRKGKSNSQPEAPWW